MELLTKLVLLGAQTLWCLSYISDATRLFPIPDTNENRARDVCVSPHQLPVLLASHQMELLSKSRKHTRPKAETVLPDGLEVTMFGDDEDFLERGSGEVDSDHTLRECDFAGPDYTNEIQNRSLCPWKFVSNIDPNRHPEILMEAVCLSESCHGLDLASGVCCEPIYEAIPILLRVTSAHCQDEGTYEFKQSTLRLAVACTCSMNRSK